VHGVFRQSGQRQERNLRHRGIELFMICEQTNCVPISGDEIGRSFPLY
jgi:hypothetical protein